jgi:hypothetical protein
MTMDGSRLRPLRYVAAALVLAGTGPLGGVASADVPYVMDDAFRAQIDSVTRMIASGDTGTALTAARALAASADQPFERYTAGQLMLQAAAAQGNLSAQRAALDIILESGGAPSARQGELRAQAGIVSAMLGDYRNAAAQIEYANRLGYASVSSQVALADAAFQTGNAQAGNAALEQGVGLRAKAGQTIDSSWYDRAIALSYRNKRPDLLALWTQRKLAAYPTPQNWRSAVVNLIAGGGLGPEQSLDLYRLLAATQALASERDWQAYSALAAQQEQFAEAKAVLDGAISGGGVNASDPAVKKSLVALTPKARKALAGVAALQAKAKAASSGTAAMTAGDAALAAGNYADAVTAYRMAIQKGGIDAARANSRLGIALARTGDLAGGKAALAQVPAGPWAHVAGLWSVWIEGKMAGGRG